MAKQISTLLENIIPKDHQWKIKLFQAWNCLIGNLKDDARIEKIDKKILTIGVSHPVIAQELTFLSEDLKEKMNAILKENKIQSIRFKVVSQKNPGFANPSTLKLKNHQNLHGAKSRIKATPGKSHNLKHIKSLGLSRALEKFYSRCKKIK